MTEEEFFELALDLRKNHEVVWAKRVRNMYKGGFVFSERMSDDAIPVRYLANVLQNPKQRDGVIFPEVPEEAMLHSDLHNWGYQSIHYGDDEHEALWTRYIKAYIALKDIKIIKGTNNPEGRERYRKGTVFWVREAQQVNVPKEIPLEDSGVVAGNSNNQSTTSHDTSSTLFPDDLPSDKTYPEGAKKQIVVNAYERSEGARKDCIKHFSENGRIKCEACNLDFVERYGEIGSGFIHVHHKLSLEQIDGEYQVDPVNDLVPLCPNCHAMLHRLPDGENSVEDLCRLIDENR